MLTKLSDQTPELSDQTPGSIKPPYTMWSLPAMNILKDILMTAGPPVDIVTLGDDGWYTQQVSTAFDPLRRERVVGTMTGESYSITDIQTVIEPKNETRLRLVTKSRTGKELTIDTGLGPRTKVIVVWPTGSKVIYSEDNIINAIPFISECPKWRIFDTIPPSYPPDFTMR